MKRSAKIANIALLAVLVSGAALVTPKSTWAADRSFSSYGNDIQTVVSQQFSPEKVLGATFNYSDRSLSNFGNLLLDTKDSSGVAFVKKLFIKEDSNLATNYIKENKEDKNDLESQSLVRTPVNLSSKITETDAIVKELFVSTSFARSEASLIGLKWENISEQELKTMISSLKSKFGQNDDSELANSISGRTSYLAESWGWSSSKLINDQVKSVNEKLAEIEGMVESNQTNELAYDQVQLLDGLLGKLDELQENLAGEFKETKSLANAFSRDSRRVNKLLSNWESLTRPEKEKNLYTLSQSVSEINQIEGVNEMLKATPSGETSDVQLKNKAYSVLGIVRANEKLLSRRVGEPLESSWLELGSVVFKTLLFNPNGNTTEMVVDYYLPKEVVKKEDIIEIDPGLTTEFDSSRKQFKVSGRFQLDPTESKIVSVRVNDLWKIDEKEIIEMGKKSDILGQDLSKYQMVPYFSEGIEIKKQIDSSLDNALNLAKKSSESPEEKISNYHEAQKEIAKAQEGIGELEKRVKVIPF